MNHYNWTDSKDITDVFLVTKPYVTLVFQDKKYHDVKHSRKPQKEPERLKKSEKKQQYVVRKVNWGMTPEQVKRSEHWGFIEEKEENGKKKISYKGTLLGVNCTLRYTFDKGVLVNVSYGMLTVSKAVELKAFLTSKYGKSTRDDRPPPSDYWITGDGKTKIVFCAAGTITIIIFSDKAYIDAEEQKEELKRQKEVRKKITILEEIF